ncbi:tetratricopeptide repeat protein [Polaribacter sp. Z014]|nr:tetratricopeptide repeat protein [Polaribacter sp. Z014]
MRLKSINTLALFILFSFVFLNKNYGQKNDSILKYELDISDKKSSYSEIYSDSKSYKEFSDSYNLAVKNKDTLSMISFRIKLSNFDRFRGNYDMAFDKLWEALVIAEEKKMQPQLLLIYRGLGILYDLYNKDELALENLEKALSLGKQLLLAKEIKKNEVASCYFNIAGFWRARKEYKKALVYLDSCVSVHKKSKILPYVMTDRGYCNLQLGNLGEAEKLLFEAKHHLEEIEATYLVTNLSFIGDLKKEQYKYNDALHYYQESLNILEKKVLHLELKPDLLQKIAEIYTIKGDLLAAVNHMKASKISYEKLFGTNSRQNQRLFEIKNKYLTEITESNKLIDLQKAVIVENDKKVFRILIIFGFVIIGVIALYLFYYQRNRIKKLSLISSLDKEKNKAVLRIKSKELTAHALQMIEKEEALHDLLQIVKKSDLASFKSLEHKYAKGSDKSWEEFNKRFTEVNVNFYESLCKIHPDLSATELKHCALIKLNFNSHEMSKVLNISVQSVHTSRYRIRKKIGLNKSESLQTYIGSI